MGGHVLAERVVGQLPDLRVPADQLQSLDHRPVCRVVTAELQHLQQRDQAPSVVTGVGGPQGGLHRPPIHRPGGLELVHQLPQGLFPAGHGREHHFPHRIIG